MPNALVPVKFYHALGAVTFIAYHGSEATPIPGAAIASHYGLKKRALEPVLQQLANAEMLQSIRGNNGGYYVANPAGISVADIAGIFAPKLLPGEEAFADIAPMITQRLTPGWQGWLAAMQHLSVADLVDTAKAAGLPNIASPTLDYTI